MAQGHGADCSRGLVQPPCLRADATVTGDLVVFGGNGIQSAAIMPRSDLGGKCVARGLVGILWLKFRSIVIASTISMTARSNLLF
jgi:hypothetical protein